MRLLGLSMYLIIDLALTSSTRSSSSRRRRRAGAVADVRRRVAGTVPLACAGPWEPGPDASLAGPPLRPLPQMLLQRRGTTAPSSSQRAP